MTQDTLEHSFSEATFPKVGQMMKVIKAELANHIRNQGMAKFGIIDLYGGPGVYPSAFGNPSFYGSTVGLHFLQDSHLIPIQHCVFEKDAKRADKLRELLGKHAMSPNGKSGYDVFKVDNKDAVEWLNTLKKYNLLPNRGVIVVDPDGSIDMDLVLSVHNCLPEYNLLMNVNASQPKRRRGKPAKNPSPTVPPLRFIELMAKLPKHSQKAMTNPRGRAQWTLVWVLMNESQAFEELQRSGEFIDFNTSEAFEMLGRLSLTEDQLNKGHTILSPFFQHVDLSCVLDLAAITKRR